MDENWSETEGILERFQNLHMVSIDNGLITLINWTKRQETSLTGYERVKRYRQRHKNDNNDNENDNIRIDKIRIDKNILPDSPQSSNQQQSTEKKTKNMKFDTDYEDVVTEDGEKVGVALKEKPNVAKAMRELLKWAETERGAKFTNHLKQFKAMKLMRLASISVEDIKGRWTEMENDKFYSVNGFDFTTVAGSFDRKRWKNIK